jgi:hypothetical protein
MKHRIMILAALGAAGLFGAVIGSTVPAAQRGAAAPPQESFDREIARHSQAMLDEGRKTFR